MKNREVSYTTIFKMFLNAGLAFGGGIGVLLALQKEMVEKEKIISKEEFLSMYGIGRIVPSGTITSLAIGFGYKYKKIPGTVVALVGVMLPGFTLTVILAALYTVIKDSEFFSLLAYSILPAAVGLILISALNMGKDVFHSTVLITFAFVAFIATYVLKINPTIVIMGGGILGVIVFAKIKGDHDFSS